MIETTKPSIIPATTEKVYDKLYLKEACIRASLTSGSVLGKIGFYRVLEDSAEEVNPNQEAQFQIGDIVEDLMANATPEEIQAYQTLIQYILKRAKAIYETT
jgi:hypothetical protein